MNKKFVRRHQKRVLTLFMAFVMAFSVLFSMVPNNVRAAASDPPAFNFHLPLKNTGFEDALDNGAIPGWTKSQDLSSGTGITVDSSEKYSGSSSIKFADPGTSDSLGIISDLVPVVPGQTYTAKAKIKSPDSTESCFYLVFYDKDGTRLEITNYSWMYAGQEWKDTSVTLTAPADAVTAAVWMYSGDGATGTTYYDDIELTTPIKLVQNLSYGSSNNTAVIGTQTNSNYLFVAVDVNDTVLVNNNAEYPWEDDSVEIYIDGSLTKGNYGPKTAQYIFRLNDNVAHKCDNSPNATGAGIVFRQADKVDGADTLGYTMEAAIPWTAIGVDASTASKVGFTAHVNDTDSQPADSGVLSLTEDPGNDWQYTTNWVELSLQDGGQIPVSASVDYALEIGNANSTAAYAKKDLLVNSDDYFINFDYMYPQNEVLIQNFNVWATYDGTNYIDTQLIQNGDTLSATSAAGTQTLDIKINPDVWYDILIHIKKDNTFEVFIDGKRALLGTSYAQPKISPDTSMNAIGYLGDTSDSEGVYGWGYYDNFKVYTATEVLFSDDFDQGTIDWSPVAGDVALSENGTDEITLDDFSLVSPATSLIAGDSKTLTVTAGLSNGKTLDPNAAEACSLTSNNEDVLKIEYAGGVPAVKAIAPGFATVTASIRYKGLVKSSVLNFTVSALDNAKTSLKGTVAGFTSEKYLKVDFNTSVNMEYLQKIIGKSIVIKGDDASKNVTYTIKGVKSVTGNRAVLDVGNVEPFAVSNPGAQFDLGAYEQDRPLGFATDGNNKIFIGTVAGYGRLKGALTVYDTATGEYTVNKDIITNQSIISLAYKGGKVYGGSSIWGGMGIDPSQTSAKFFVYDVASGVKEKEIIPVEGKKAITALIAGPDGNIWGMDEGCLFIYDPIAGEITYNQNIISRVNYAGADVVYNDAYMVIGKDGNVYMTIGGGLYKIDAITKALTTIKGGGAYGLAQDHSGNLYYKNASSLYKYDLTADKETNLGAQVNSSSTFAAAFGKDQAGNNLFYTVEIGSTEVNAKFYVINAQTMDIIDEHELPLTEGSWAVTVASDNKVYVSSYSTGHVYQYLDDTKEFTDLGQASSPDTWIGDMQPGGNGEIYGGTFNSSGGNVFKYDSANGFKQIGSSPFMAGEQYVRSVAVDTGNQILYAGIGAHAHLIRYDLQSGESQDILPDKYKSYSFVYNLNYVDGKVFAKLEDGGKTPVLSVTKNEDDSLNVSVDCEIPKVSSLGVTQSYENKVYYVGGNGALNYYDIATKQYGLVLNGGAPVPIPFWAVEVALVEMKDQASYPGYTFLAAGSVNGQICLYKYNLQTGDVSISTPDVTPLPNTINLIAAGPDGKIYSSGYLYGGTGIYNPEDGTTVEYKGVGQCEGIGILGNKMYFDAYPGSIIYEYDTTLPWDMNLSTFEISLATTPGSDTPSPGTGNNGSDSNTSGSNTDDADKIVINGNNADVKSTLHDGTASVEITSEDLNKLFNNAKAENGVSQVRINAEAVSGANEYVLSLPSNFVSSTLHDKEIEISTPIGNLTVPSNMISRDVIGSAATVSYSIGTIDKAILSAEQRAAIGNKPVIELKAFLDGKAIEWNNPEAPVTVTVKYTPTANELKNYEHIVVWYIDGNGNAIAVPNGKYNPATGEITFTTTHFSKYAAAFVNKTFSDTAAYGWAEKQIGVLASKGIISGTSDTTYAPGEKITRADFLVLLVRGLELTARIDSNFSDVSAKDYYYEAVGIAKKLGITEGIGGNRFNPKAPITRQDMMVMTDKALKIAGKLSVTGNAVDLAGYSDAAEIAAYAETSVADLVKDGIIEGSGSRINPLGKATRAEIAVLIYRIYNK